jgi:hypothetical protein
MLCTYFLIKLSANLTMTNDHILQRGQAIQANWAAGMQLIIRNPNFCTQAVLKAIGKTSTCIYR